jgi:hypothetical protein
MRSYPRRWHYLDSVLLSLFSKSIRVGGACCTLEVDQSGAPLTYEFLYEAVYRWTSHFVHPTVVALDSHLVQAGRDPFSVHARGLISGSQYYQMALFNVVSFLGQIAHQFFRGMADPVPPRYSRYLELQQRAL